ncbi:hypothetical protein [Methylobacterium planeticum]|uniref:hypothetical protein n=1 Tax=Methylobacterium planeticum TaxID=2615211 RepID=UPI001FEE6606|nr:hypothetical protein [Methylobacterium planeticum]
MQYEIKVAGADKEQTVKIHPDGTVMGHRPMCEICRMRQWVGSQPAYKNSSETFLLTARMGREEKCPCAHAPS